MAAVTDAEGHEHLALSDGEVRIRIDVLEGSLLRGAVLPVWELLGLRRTAAQMTTLGQLIDLERCRAFRPSLYPPLSRLERQLDVLRASDALADGASQRAFAIALFGAQAVSAEWKERSGPLRSRVRRLFRDARVSERRPFWSWLRAG